MLLILAGMKKLLLTAFLYGCMCFSYAQTTAYQIKAGKLFDSESGTFQTNKVILVRGEKVDTVKNSQDLTAADQKTYATVIDLSAYTVMPGLIDAHTHLLYREVVHPGDNPPAMDMAKMLTLEGDAYRALYGAARAKAYLENGITAVQDLGNSGNFGDVALQRAINEGLVMGPRMRCSGPGLSTEGGQFPGLIYKHRDMANDEYRIVTGVEDARQAVRENITQGADVIKIYANNTPNKTMLSIEEIRAIVTEAHRYGVRVTAHATNNTSVWNAVKGGVDGIEHGYRLDDTTLQLMAKQNVVMVPTFSDSTVMADFVQLHNLGNAEEIKRTPEITASYNQYKTSMLQRMREKGVTIVAGSDDYVATTLPMGETSKRSLIGYVEAGMSIKETLRSATIHAAAHLRWKDKIGVIKKGAFADIVAFDGDLDTNINALLKTHFVMKGGKVYKGK
jgi:imidazolonepropionase-like amidohydrolase